MAKRAQKKAKPQSAKSRFHVKQEQQLPQSFEAVVPAKTTLGFSLKKSYVGIALGILLIIILLYVFKDQLIVATVNGQPITRFSFNQELEKQSGKRVLGALVTKILIYQEADREHVSISDKEINDEVKGISSDLKKQGQNLDQALAARGTTQDDLKEQIKIQKLIEKMLGKDVQVTDKEVDDYIAKNKSASDTEDQTTAAKLPSRDVIKQELKNEKIRAKFTPWLQKLQDKAKINYFVKY